MNAVITRSWKIYGAEGHRQKESFNQSARYDWSKDGIIRIVEVSNADVTGTNEYSIITITANTYDDCDAELEGQLSDGIFENYRVGCIEEIEIENKKVWYALQADSSDAWDDGTWNKQEAIDRLLNDERYNLIAVIENDVCIEEIRKEDM